MASFNQGIGLKDWGLMEVDMPSSALKRMFVGALLCATCTMDFAIAQAAPQMGSPVSVLSSDSSPQTGFWPRLFSCKSKNDVGIGAGASGTTFVESNLLTKERAEAFAKRYWGERAGASYVLSVGRSKPWRIGWFLITVSAGGYAYYLHVMCD
jgi:hypothetical protein